MFMRKRWLLIGAAAVVCLAVLYFIHGRTTSGTPAYQVTTVARGTVANVVSVTGNVEPVERLTLAFPTGGRLATVAVHEGDRVRAGDLIAQLDDRDAQAALAQAEAALAQAQAVRADVAAPVRDETRALKDAALASAEAALAQAHQSARTVVANTFTSADSAIHEDADSLFQDPDSDVATFGLTYSYGSTHYTLQADAATEVRINDERRNALAALAALRARKDAAEDSLGALADTDTDLDVIAGFLSDLAATVNRYVPTDTYAQTVYETFQTAVATARSTVATARTSVAAAQQTLAAAEAARTVAARDLALAVAGAATSTRTVQDAAVRTAAEAVAAARAHLANLTLTAPFSGTVTRVDLSVGDAVAPYGSVAELLTEGAYEIDAYIPEADIARVKLGDAATVTFDAFQRADVFTAEVTKLSLSETVREGVPTYKTTLMLTSSPDQTLIVRPGMTANVDITTDTRTDVLYVPSRSIVTDANGNSSVLLPAEATTTTQAITLGLHGSEGTTEVTSGLTEGETIVLYMPGS